MAPWRDEVESTLEEAGYLALGLVLLGFQRAKVRSRELTDAPPLTRAVAIAASAAEPLLAPLREVAGRAAKALGQPGT